MIVTTSYFHVLLSVNQFSSSSSGTVSGVATPIGCVRIYFVALVLVLKVNVHQNSPTALRLIEAGQLIIA